MMKKFLTLLVIAMLSLTGFMFACGGDDDPVDTRVLAFEVETTSVRVYEELQLLPTQEGIVGDLSYESSDKSKATVDKDGKVTGKAEGSCVITVSADGLSDTITITVLPYDEAKISVINPYVEANIFEGETKDLGITMGYDGKAIALGTFTYSIPEEDSGIATVNAKGKITAVACGETTLHVVGKIGNKVIDEFDVIIKVGEKVAVTTNTSAFQIYVFEGSDLEEGQEGKPTSFKIDAEAFVNDAKVEGAAIEFTGYDEELVSIDETGLVTVNTTYKTGSTTITVKYASEKGTEAFKTVEVNVIKPSKQIVLDGFEFKSGATFNAINFSGEDYQFPALKTVSVDGRLLTADEFSYSNFVLKISANALANTTNSETKAFNSTHAVQIVAENEKEAFVFDTTVTTIDFVIKDAETLNEFINAVKVVSLQEQKGFHAILDANVDFGGANFETRGSTTSHGYFTGILDGRGYTIANITVPRNGMIWGFGNCIIKNIAFVNVRKNSTNDGALLAWNSSGGGKLQNVYIQGTVNGAAEKTCGLANSASGLVCENFIMDVEFTQADKHFAMDRAGSSWLGQNTIAISSTAIGFADCLPGGDVNNLWLKDIKQLRELPQTTIEKFTSAKVGEKDIWEFAKDTDAEDSTGVLVFKTAVAYLDKLNQENNALELTIDTVDFIEEKELIGDQFVSTFVIGKGANEIKANISNATFVLEQNVEGVIVDNGVIDIAESVADGTKIVIIGSAYAAHTCEKLETKLTLVVGTTTAITIEGEEKELVKNQETKSSVSISLGDQALDNPQTLSAKFKGSVISSENVKIENNNLIVDGAGLTTSGSGILEINLKTVKTEGDATVTNYYVVKAPISVVDYEIGTKDEFTAFYNDLLAGKLTKDSYIRLTKDIDLGGQKYGSSSNPANFPRLTGTFDGQGHVINNGHVEKYSFFTGLSNVVIKNVAFINIIKDQGSDGGLFSNGENVNVVMENVFIQGKTTVQGTRIWGLAQNFAGKQTTLNNVIVAAEFTGEGSADRPYNVFGFTGAFATATNVYAISQTAQGYSNAKDGTVYGSLRGATSSMDEATIKAFTDTGFWVYDEQAKSIYFKGTKDLLKESENVELAVDTKNFIPNGSSYVVLQGSAYNLSSNVVGTEFELTTPVEGVTIENNVLTIAKEVALGTKINLTVTAYGSVANTPYTQSFELVVGEVLEAEKYIKNKDVVTNTNISKFNATATNTVVTVNGETVEFIIENGILKIDVKDLPASVKAVDKKMVVEPLSVQIVVDGTKVIIAKYEVVDMLIETAEDFKTWVETVKTENKNAINNSYYVVLANDIDLANITFEHTVHNNDKDNGTGYIQGLFEGNGHTVKNLTLKNAKTGLFVNYGVFTVQNVAFTNAKALAESTYGYLFGVKNVDTNAMFTIKNSYIDFTSEKKAGSGLVNASAYLTVENSVLSLEYANTTTATIGNSVMLTNTMIVSGTGKTFTANAASKNWGLYTTFDKLATAVCNNKINIDIFDELTYWTTADNYPVWVGAQA